jgi:hypothetical protein
MMKLIAILLTTFSFYCASPGRYMAKEEARSYGGQGISGGISSEPQKKTTSTSKSRLLVYNVSVRIQSQKIEEKVTELIKLAETYQGYSVQYNSHGNLTIKIPSDQLKAFLEKVRAGSEQYYEEISATDVTEEFYDTEVRLENAKKIRTRLLEILKQAKTVEEILKVEVEVSKASETVDVLEGKIKYLSNNIAFSTVKITISLKYEAPKNSEYKPGPLGLPFYYAYKGLGILVDGILWLFIQEE